MSKLFTTEAGHPMPNLAEESTTSRRARKSPPAAWPARGFAMALSAVVFAVIAIACGSDSGTSTTAPRTDILEPCIEDGYCGVFAVGGHLLAAAWLDDKRMYLSDMGGRIRLLNVDTGDIETALEGLTIPQGLTVLGGRLYVSELGNYCQLTKELATQENSRECRSPSIDYRDAQKELLSRIDARILSYRIDEIGRLDDRQIVVDRLPALSIEHSPNGLINDGEYVYASIGSILHDKTEYAHYADLIEELGDQSPRMDLNGVIARFRPSDGEVEVFASGFRNIYGFSIAPDGTIYGADNDDRYIGEGVARHREELNAIVEGGFYGYPHWGTNEAPPEENVTEPVAILPGAISTQAYATEDGVYVAYRVLDAGPDTGFVVDKFDYETWKSQRFVRARVHTTAILEQDDLLYMVSFDGNVHIINPHASLLPIYLRPTDEFLSDDYVDEVIASDDPSVSESGYDMYVDGSRLIYTKGQCKQEDIDLRFFLHIVPVDTNDLQEHRREHGFENRNFYINNSGKGWRAGSSCYVVVDLPEYQILEIRTGQFTRETEGFTNTWEAEYRLRDNEYVSTIISSVAPIIQSSYDVYLDGGRLLYAKSSCNEADRTTRFFLHVVPVDTSDLAEGREEHGFDNLDFSFITGQGWRSGQSCFAIVELPEYEIQEIRTGQTVLGEDGYTNRWNAEYRFER